MFCAAAPASLSGVCKASPDERLRGVKSLPEAAQAIEQIAGFIEAEE